MIERGTILPARIVSGLICCHPTASTAIFAVVTALSASFAVVTAPSSSLAVVIALLLISEVVIPRVTGAVASVVTAGVSFVASFVFCLAVATSSPSG